MRYFNVYHEKYKAFIFIENHCSRWLVVNEQMSREERIDFDDSGVMLNIRYAAFWSLNDEKTNFYSVDHMTKTFPMSTVNDAMEKLRTGKLRFQLFLENDLN